MTNWLPDAIAAVHTERFPIRLGFVEDAASGSPGDVLAEYTYLGLGTVVIEDYQEPQIRLDLFGGTSGAYAGFNRVIDHRGLNYNTSEDVDRFKYGYDRASNRAWKENTVSKAQTTPVYLGELYTYDGLHRLKTFDRGELNGTKTAITGTPAKEEDWTLDALGNWSGYIQMTAGTTDLNQQRSANAVNEIADITESVGTSWVTSVFHSEISSAGGLLNVSRVRSNHSTLRMSGRMRD